MAGCVALGLCLGGAAHAAPPQRVVSMNLCTDQLAMLLAAPGQLVSVSYLARDPRSSAMADQAALMEVNHGLAEEIYLLEPDLVLAGRYTTATTVALLQRLNIPVATFDPETDFDDIRTNIRKMANLLGRDAQAGALIGQFDRDLALLSDPGNTAPRAALYYANGYTSGDHSLAGKILTAAGLRNIAAEAAVPAGGVLSLEQLVLSDPDLLIRGQRYGTPSRAEMVLNHPALIALAGSHAGEGDDGDRDGGGLLTDRDWVCGTPSVLNAVAALRDARLRLMQAGNP